MPTSQDEANALLAEDQDRRSLERVERRLHESLAAIDRDAKARAAPIVAQLVALDAQRPRPPVAICGGCGKPIGFDWLLGSRCGCTDATDALGDRFGAPPFSLADQTRNALLAAFEPETDCTRARLRKLLAAASDATLERARRLIRDR